VIFIMAVIPCPRSGAEFVSAASVHWSQLGLARFGRGGKNSDDGEI
jgi:hypothetical protein